MSERDKLKNMVTISKAAITMKVVDRQKRQEDEVYKIMKKFRTVEGLINLDNIAKLIGLTSGDILTNRKLRYATKQLMVQMSRPVQVYELTFQLMNKVEMAAIDSVGGHFGSWEETIRKVILAELGSTTIADESIFLPANMEKILEETFSKTDRMVM